jgi:hypothetical protein
MSKQGFEKCLDVRTQSAKLFVLNYFSSHNFLVCLYKATHYLAVSEVRERLAESKQTAYRIHMERFNLKKLNKVDGKEQYCVEISNRFAALENLDAGVDVNKAWETIRENIKISAKESPAYSELKKHKPWSMKGAQNYYTKGNKPYCSGYSIQEK